MNYFFLLEDMFSSLSNPLIGEAIARIDYETLLSDFEEMDFPVSCFAVQYNSMELVSYLVSHGHDLNEVDPWGRSTYNYMELYANEELQTLLVENGLVPDNNLDQARYNLKQGRARTRVVQTTEDLMAAHLHTYNNGMNLFAQQHCGCIYCRRTFSSADISQFTNGEHGTALCPHCGIDAVVGEVAGFVIDKEFLHRMYEHYFRNGDSVSKHITEWDLEAELLGKKIKH